VPDVGEASAAAFLEGIATVSERLIMILGLERLSEASAPMAEAA
jgi:purine-binding chemotaxis protein CheW